MGRVVPWIVASLLTIFLCGCPTKDWVKRDDDHLTVEQYKTITEVVKVNDVLYRVKKGEEINENKITRLFTNLQNVIESDVEENKNELNNLKRLYESERSIFNTMTYVLAMLENNVEEKEVLTVLSDMKLSSIKREDKDLVNLAQILHRVLKSNVKLQRDQKQLKRKYTTTRRNYQSVQKDFRTVKKELTFLTEQVNALKSIEDSIHAREVGIEVESR